MHVIEIDAKQFFELIIYEIRLNFDTPLALKWLKMVSNLHLFCKCFELFAISVNQIDIRKFFEHLILKIGLNFDPSLPLKWLKMAQNRNFFI